VPLDRVFSEISFGILYVVFPMDIHSQILMGLEKFRQDMHRDFEPFRKDIQNDCQKIQETIAKIQEKCNMEIINIYTKTNMIKKDMPGII
jgi:hypothetical protein